MCVPVMWTSMITDPIGTIMSKFGRVGHSWKKRREGLRGNSAEAGIVEWISDIVALILLTVSIA